MVFDRLRDSQQAVFVPLNGECCKQFSGLSLTFPAFLATRLGQPVCFSLQLEENPANYDGRFAHVIQYVFLSWCIVLDFQDDIYVFSFRVCGCAFYVRPS